MLKIRKSDKENIPDLPRGRPSKISDRTRSSLARQFNTGELKSIEEGQRYIKSVEGDHVHATTIKRNLKKKEVRAYVRQKKPKISPSNRAERYDFARRHLHWTEVQWRAVMFSDESIFSKMGSFGRQYYYSDKEHKTLAPHQIKETQHFGGGKIMVWGCMGYNRLGDLVRLEGNVNSDDYIDTLEQCLLKSRDWCELDPSIFIFQHDNCSAHISKRVKEWFAKKKIEVLKWPANSPDLNLIEYIWRYIKGKLQEYKEAAKNLDELWKRIEDIWVNVSQNEIHKLYQGMPSRIREVYMKRGGPTKY